MSKHCFDDNLSAWHVYKNILLCPRLGLPGTMVAVPSNHQMESSKSPALTLALLLICPGLPFSAVETSCDFETDLCNFYQDKDGPGWTRVRVKPNMYRAGDHTTGAGESQVCQAAQPGFHTPLALLILFLQRQWGKKRGKEWRWRLFIYHFLCSLKWFSARRVRFISVFYPRWVNLPKFKKGFVGPSFPPQIRPSGTWW